MKLIAKITFITGCIASTFAMAQTRITGAGATFPQPLYERWIVDYGKTHGGVQIDYGGGGSGQGIKGITDKTIDFAGSDAPMTKSELEKIGGPDAVVEIPSCAGSVVPAYNVPGVKELNFTGALLADIFMGKVSNWNDAAIKSINPDVKLPDLAIAPAWRTDGSGTNYVFTNYLATQSDEFKDTVGVGKQVKWPVGQGGKGNPGVAAIVQQTAGAIGFIEQNYADKNGLAYGSVKNQAGKFIKASPDTVRAAGAAAAEHFKGTTLTANLWNQPGETTYPIASFSYLIVYKDLQNLHSKEQADSLVNFLQWSLHDGQAVAADLDYASLDPAVTTKVDAALAMITFKGEAIQASRK